jgi:hypothetical protein
MKCCASPTISTAAEAMPSREFNGPQTVRDVTDALLFREILRPLAAALGPVGDCVLGDVAASLFVRRSR